MEDVVALIDARSAKVGCKTLVGLMPRWLRDAIMIALIAAAIAALFYFPGLLHSK
jgi:hypothetical protein